MRDFLPSRRDILIGAGAAIMTRRLSRADTMDWPTIAPADTGIEARLDAALAAGRLPNLHGVVAVRRGQLVLERYGEGEDDSRGQPLGRVPFRPETLHDVRSVTKSIVGLLYGIALATGKVPAPDQPLLPQFPEYDDLAADPDRRRWTVAHALTMTLGTEWNEDLPYNDPA